MRFPTTTAVITLLITLLALPLPASTQNPTEIWTDWTTTGLTDYEAIIQTINLEVISTNTRNWSLIPQIFTPDIWASYHPDVPPIVGLANLTNFVVNAVAGYVTQHLQGTHMVDLAADGRSARATTYAQATLFADPLQSPGQVVWFYGYYNDRLIKTGEGWRISHRYYRFVSRGSVGNLTLLGEA